MNHPIQSPSWHGRYPRTLEQAFGPGATLTVARATPRHHWIGWLLVGLIVCATIGAGVMK